MIQKSYDCDNANVYIIPTPIGNMEDITIRALETIKKVDVIFSEDTRVTRQLLNYYNIEKKLISNHEYNESKNIDRIINLLEQKQNIGIVTDRGTPIISDPGFELAKVAIEHNYNVISLPGATALIPALVNSGIQPSPFIFYGFLNSKESKKVSELKLLKNSQFTLVFYEAPHRLKSTLSIMLKILGDRDVSISREISKKFEEVVRGKISEVIDQVNIKGEFVIVVSGNKEKQIKKIEKKDVIEKINSYIQSGIKPNQAIGMTAKELGLSRGEAYELYHNIKK